MKKEGSRFASISGSNFHSSKRSQTTILIILSIVIVVGILSTAFVITQNKKTALSKEYFSQANIKPTLESIKSQIIECSKETSINALEKIGLQGGHYKKPDKYFDLKSFFIPYYYYEGTYYPTNQINSEKELNNYINENLENCLEEINYEDYRISYKIPRTESKIRDKEVIFKTNQQFKIEKEDNFITFELSDYPQKIPSELKSIITLADFMTESHKQDPAMYCISCLADLAEKDDLFIDIFNFRENEILVIISENHTSSSPYSFEFLNKYTGEEISPLIEKIETAPDSPHK